MGYIKLPAQKKEGTNKAVFESDLLDYFFTESGVRLQPLQIRKFYYKAPRK